MAPVLHVVLFRLRRDQEQKIADTTRQVLTLRSLPGVLDLSFGPHSNSVHAEYKDRSQGYTHILSVTFESPEALRAYTDNERHAKVRDDYLKPLYDQESGGPPAAICIDTVLPERESKAVPSETKREGADGKSEVKSASESGSGCGEKRGRCGRRGCGDGGCGDRCGRRKCKGRRKIYAALAGVALGVAATVLVCNLRCRSSCGSRYGRHYGCGPCPPNCAPGTTTTAGIKTGGGGCPVVHVPAPSSAPSSPPPAVKA